MHPLTLFPDLLTFGLIAPFLLRIAAGLFVGYVGLERYKKPYKWLWVIHAICAILLVVGLYTQIAAILSIAVLKFNYIVDKKVSKPTKEHLMLYVIVEIILLSLLFTGPGFFAFDLPL